jgi:hypothetical protein
VQASQALQALPALWALRAMPALPESLEESLEDGTVSAGSILQRHVIAGSRSSQNVIE